MVRYVAILLSSMQCVEGFQIALKMIIGVRLCLNSQQHKKIKDAMNTDKGIN